MGRPLRPHPEVLVPEQQRVLLQTKPLAQKWGAYLAGGAALALQLGHRRSRDFDWFTKETLPPENVASDLKATGLSLSIRENTVGTLHADVGGVEYSLFRYRYDLIAPLVNFEGCNLASLADICAMKLAAIHQRAVKRDYVDLYMIFHRGGFTLDRALQSWHHKFPQADPSFALNARFTSKMSRTRPCRRC